MLGVMGTKTTEINDEKIDLNVNPKHETKKNKDKNIKYARPKYKQTFITMKQANINKKKRKGYETRLCLFQP